MSQGVAEAAAITINGVQRANERLNFFRFSLKAASGVYLLISWSRSPIFR